MPLPWRTPLGRLVAVAACVTIAAPAVARAEPARETAVAPASSHAVAAPTVEGLGEFPSADQERLNARFRDGLSRAGFQVAEGNGADAIVRTTVAKQRGDYIITAEYEQQGSPPLVVQDTCELCGVDELGESLASVGSRLKRKVSQLGESAKLRVTSSPEGAEVRLNGELIGETPLEAEVPPGDYKLTVGRQGYGDESRRVSLEPATQASFTMTLRRQGYKKWLPWVALGTGVASLGAGIALIAIDKNEIQGDCNADIDGRCQYLHDTLAGGVTMAIVGSALVITGTTLAIMWRRDRKRGRSAWRLQPSPRGLAIRF